MADILARGDVPQFSLAFMHEGTSDQFDGGFEEAAGAITSISAVPEPAAWALMLIGFSFVGIAMRRGRRHRVLL